MMGRSEKIVFKSIYVTFGEWVMLMRKRKKLTQKEIAARYAIDSSLVSRMEKDLYVPAPAVRRDLCAFLGDVDIVP